MPTNAIKPTRGPLSAAAQQSIRDLAGKGVSIQDIATEIGRSEQVVTKVLIGGGKAVSEKTKAKRVAQTKRGAETKRPPAMAKQGPDSRKATQKNVRLAGQGRREIKKVERVAKKPEPVAKKASKSVRNSTESQSLAKRPGAGALLEHRFWLRSGLSVNLTLPGDLRADEAERLAAVVRTLPFSA